jgi:S1-C subfamily serine protease
VNSLIAQTEQVRVTCVDEATDTDVSWRDGPESVVVLGTVVVRSWTGTGVWIGPHNEGSILATAGHVAPNEADGVCVTTVGNKPGLVLKSTSPLAEDAALIWFPVDYHWAVLEPSEPYLGQYVWAVGYPYQFIDGTTGLQVSSGELIYHSLARDRFRVGSSFYKGSSGGPVFDRDGRLVGLSVAVLMLAGQYPIPDEFYVTPAANVFKLYKELTDEDESTCTEGSGCSL